MLVNAYKQDRADAAALEPALVEMERLNLVASRLALAHGATAPPTSPASPSPDMPATSPAVAARAASATPTCRSIPVSSTWWRPG
ncbi:MAG: hypothetical protein R2862_12175 [Thermoanaerobaculia bacterium]